MAPFLAAYTPDPMVLAGLLLVAGFFTAHLGFGDRPIWRFLCQFGFFVGFTTLLLIAGVNPSDPTPAMAHSIRYVMSGVFKIVWWLAAASLLTAFFRAALVFKRQPRETRFLQDVISGAIYIGAVLAIIANVFNMPVSGLLAASGVIAIVLGLALQSTLGDVFSGVVLNLGKPYHPGDWITLDGGLQGRVVETNWRATQLLTLDNDLAFVPNSVIAKARLVNASTNIRAHGVTIAVRLDPSVAPARCRAMLNMALLNSNRILRIPPSQVTVSSLDAMALECEVRFFVASIELGNDAKSELFEMIFRHAAATGIRLAAPSSSSILLPLRAARPDISDVPLLLLEHLPIFAPLSDSERVALAQGMKQRTYAAGDILVAQGSIAHALFILTSGVLSAHQGVGSKATEILRLAPGDCFGQASILTGAATGFEVRAVTAATVYEIAKTDIAPILKERPAIAAELGQILARREAAGEARMEQDAGPDVLSDPLAARLAERVRSFFGLV